VPPSVSSSVFSGTETSHDAADADGCGCGLRDVGEATAAGPAPAPARSVPHEVSVQQQASAAATASRRIGMFMGVPLSEGQRETPGARFHAVHAHHAVRHVTS
jgi:hypothetical protein